ncbi:MAG TPA: AmmeMemoRadiSam system protein B [Bacteroidales bacterium]|mgnify:CR=1 FL=1|nr:AmmeMemoRadiSam system protein B [Bacteroidales bacterium]
MKIRKPSVAGSFYPAGREQLLSMIRTMELEQELPDSTGSNYDKIFGGIVPHAGYMYSGSIALPFFQMIAAWPTQFETIVILHPNHYGHGPDMALDVHDAWETPLGITKIDLEPAKMLNIEKSADAHRFEHSAEVMLPLLQYFLPYTFRILPVALAHCDPASGKKLSIRLRDAMNASGRKMLIIASSDFSHFVSPELGKNLDDKAIEHISKLNTQAFYETVNRHNISICGYMPILTLMEFAKMAGRNPVVEMLARGHSGQVTAHDDVVHYVTMLFYEPAAS